MARDATRLLPPVLLVLLASGSWEQKPELLRKLEGETISVKCLYQSWQDSKSVKAWCRQVSARTCTVLASYPRIQGMQWKPGNSIQDWVRLGYFIVTMTKLKVEDSGFYSCGIYKSSEILTYRNIHLVVSPGEPLLTAWSVTTQAMAHCHSMYGRGCTL
uniref:Ig-like domain-containing protein n=1 Tax=Canis lupus dingo TaxID=286419 RepID=A0A8C0K7M2_CANLU